MAEDSTAEAEASFWPTPAGGAKTAPPPVRTAARQPIPPKTAPAASSLRLADLCEPLFQYVCRLNRSARQHGNANPSQVRADIMAMLTDARKQAASGGAPPGGPSLAEQWKAVEPALLFFVDFMIRSSTLPFASRWDDLARQLNNEMSGDEKFFDLLEAALADRSEAGAERLSVFYTCIGLGFSGFYTGQPEYLRRKMLDCSSRIRDRIDAGGKVCPDAYENVNTSDLIESPGRSIVGIVIALVGLTLVLFVANGYWYRNSVRSLQTQVGGLSSAVHETPKTAGTGTQER
jgi:type IV/VI secretion system ImpK/VasF family protein